MGVKKIRGVKKMSPPPPMVSLATWSADHDFLCVRPYTVVSPPIGSSTSQTPKNKSWDVLEPIGG